MLAGDAEAAAPFCFRTARELERDVFGDAEPLLREAPRGLGRAALRGLLAVPTPAEAGRAFASPAEAGRGSAALARFLTSVAARLLQLRTPPREAGTGLQPKPLAGLPLPGLAKEWSGSAEAPSPSAPATAFASPCLGLKRGLGGGTSAMSPGTPPPALGLTKGVTVD